MKDDSPDAHGPDQSPKLSFLLSYSLRTLSPGLSVVSLLFYNSTISSISSSRSGQWRNKTRGGVDEQQGSGSRPRSAQSSSHKVFRTQWSMQKRIHKSWGKKALRWGVFTEEHQSRLLR